MTTQRATLLIRLKICAAERAIYTVTRRRPPTPHCVRRPMTSRIATAAGRRWTTRLRQTRLHLPPRPPTPHRCPSRRARPEKLEQVFPFLGRLPQYFGNVLPKEGQALPEVGAVLPILYAVFPKERQPLPQIWAGPALLFTHLCQSVARPAQTWGGCCPELGRLLP